MNRSMAAALALIRPHLAPTLVSEDAFSRLLHVAGFLPPVYWGGLECHLGDGPDDVDFHQGYNRIGALEKCILQLAAWPAPNRKAFAERLTSFRSHWTQAGSSIHRHVNGISLEFDVARHDDRVGLPSVFLLLDPLIPLANGGELEAMIEPFLTALTSASVPAGIYRNVEKLARIAGDVEIGHLGAMTSRKTCALRMVIVRLRRGKVIDTIARLRSADEAARIEPILADLEADTGSFALSLDILPESIAPRYGIESHPKPAEGEPDAWSPWIQRVADMGFCSNEQAEALVRWPGWTTPANTDVSWPEDLITASLKNRNHQFTCFLRYLNHVKISFAPGRRPKAKAYLGFLHDWLDPKRGPSTGGPGARRRKAT